MHLESLAFVPQLLLSAVALPFVLAKRDLGSTMLAQTYAFVTFNKVCTSQVRLLSLASPSSFLTLPVLLVVPRFSTVLSPKFKSATETSARHRSSRLLGCWSGSLVTTSLPVRILGYFDLLPRPMVVEHRLLLDQLLDPRNHH